MNRRPSFRHWLLRIFCCAFWCIAIHASVWAESSNNDNTLAIRPTVRLTNDLAQDQDDMCVLCPGVTHSRTLIFVSDKKANSIFTYNMDGNLVDTVAVPMPGNIDIRTDVLVGSKREAVVVVNLREVNQLAVFIVNREKGQLERIDGGRLSTIENYGGALYHDKKTGELSFIVTSKTAGAAQYLVIDAAGNLDGSCKQKFELGMCEGAVADDGAGVVYIGEETEGVRRIALSTDKAADGKMVVRTGEHGLAGDVEGLAIASIDNRKCLLLSDQGTSRYRVYDIDNDYQYVGSFSIEGAQSTDGIEVATRHLGDAFPNGIFLCHTDIDNGRTVLLTRWDAVVQTFHRH